MILPNEILTSILNSIGQPALIFCDNHIIATNTLALDLIGYSAQDIQHLRLLKLIYPASRRAALKYYDSIRTNPNLHESVSLRLCPAYEKLCWGTITIKPAPYVGDNCFLAIINEITQEIITPTINYPSIVEQLPIGIYRTTPEGKVIYANKTFAKMLGFETVDELKQHNTRGFYDDPDQRQKIIQSWEKGQELHEGDLLWRNLQGDELWIKIIGQIIRDEFGKILYFQGSAEDTTLHKQQELQLQKRHQEIKTLQQISVELGKSLDLKQTLQTVLDQMQQIVPFISASIFLIRENQMELLAEKGLPNTVRFHIQEMDKQFLAISRFYNFDKQDVMIIPDVREAGGWKHLDDMNYIRSWMGIALRYNNDILGVLNLDHTEIDFYNDDHMRYAQAVAGQAAVAIANAQYYETAQEEIRKRQEAQDILISNLINTETIYWVLRHLFAAESLTDVLEAVINMLGAALEKTELMLVVFEPERGVLQHILKTEDSTFDIWDIFKAISNYPELPLKKMPPKDFNWADGYHYEFADGRKAIAAAVWQRGMLAAVRTTPDADNFSEANVELLVTVANQLTIALQNEENTRRLREQSERLQRVAEQQSNRLNFELKSQNAILDATAEGIFYMENFRMQYANPAFCRMVGYTIDELYGQPLSFIHESPDNNDMLPFTDMVNNNALIEMGRSETKLRHKDGTEFYANIRFSMIGEPGDDMLRMVAVARDITQERELYFQRARFIANAAHELRNPLSSLILRTHMMKRQPENAGKHVENLDRVVNYLHHIVEELLDLSRFERGIITLERTDFILQEVVNEVLETNTDFAQEQSITLHKKMATEPIMMRGDRSRVTQLLNHLTINGINYNKSGGEVTLHAYLEKDNLDNRNVIIEVSDNGIGMSSDLLPSQIFEPFIRPSEGTRRETGMGLAIAREIVLLHSGTIQAHSEEGEGSTFRVLLPLN